MRIAVIGDIGGQIGVFRDVIKSLGGNPDTGQLPENLKVVQVGDIVRFNSSADLDSTACVELADKLLETNNGNYVQLLGNHETPLLGGILHPGWDIQDLPASRPIVQKWWNQKQAHLAITLVSPDKKDILITHAGLTRGYMESLNTSTASEATTVLNSYVGNSSVADLENPGGLVTKVTNKNADIFWALCGPELHAGWWSNPSGFNQIHGHACLYRWDAGEYWSDVVEEIQQNTIVNVDDRYTLTTHPSGDWLRSVDWVLGNTTKIYDWPVLILDGYDIFLG